MKVIKDYVNALTVDNENRSNKQIERQIKCLFAAIREDIEAGNDVRINNFGTFKLVTRSARSERQGRNPSTGEPLTIAAQPEKQVITFKPSKSSK